MLNLYSKLYFQSALTKERLNLLNAKVKNNFFSSDLKMSNALLRSSIFHRNLQRP